MMDKAKLPILLILLLVVSLSLAGGMFYLLQNERTKNLALQEELEDTKTRQKVAETKLKESEKFISELKTKLQEANTQVAALNTGLQQEKAARFEAQAKLEQLKIDLEQQKTLGQELEGKFNLAQKDLEKLQRQLKELESKKTELETKIKNLEAQAPEDVELGKIVVSPEVSTSSVQESVKSTKEQAKAKGPVSSLEGKILVINKDYNFVVINLGSRDGVDLADEFLVYHNDKYIGDVKVEKVHDSMAAAGFLMPQIRDKVNEGDKVVRKTK